MIRIVLILATLLMTATAAIAEVRTETIPYRHNGVELEGIMAWDEGVKGKRPGVLVVHEWWGLNDYVRARAKQLARMGYVAFALDMYGKGKVTRHPDQAGEWMRAVQGNKTNWRARALQGLAVLRGHRLVDSSKVAAIGYCFGGATVLQLAYAGAPVRGVVSFHGALPLPVPASPGGDAPKILIAHGNADPFLSEQHIAKVRAALDAGQWDWQMIAFAGARHGFTNPGADAYGMDALRYDRKADHRSWTYMQLFFDEIFARAQ